MSPTDTPTVPAAHSARQDIRTIALIGLGHCTSHFHHMLLPPLFPVFIREFGYSYAELGLLLTVFFVISGIGQTLAGFLVDRHGARPVLYGAMVCYVAASLATATAQGYAGLMLAAALAGLGNAPMHPANFTILNRRVSPERLGHAFSAHGLSGNLGWALAPVFLIGLTSLTGSWRIAALCAAILGIVVLALMLWRRADLDDHHLAHRAQVQAQAASGKEEHAFAFLKLPAVWLCFAFFLWSAAALGAIQSFASPALNLMYGLTDTTTAFVVTGYMLCGAVGMLIGGFLVNRVERLERTISVSIGVSVLMLLLSASGQLPPWLAALSVVLAGFGTGLANPSRDMLIKRAAPPGATGRVYGTVYAGLDTGLALAAPAFGLLMDHGYPAAVFAGAALTLALGIVSANIVGQRMVRRH